MESISVSTHSPPSTSSDVYIEISAERVMQDCEGRYRLIADNVRDIIVLGDRDLRRRYVSPSVMPVLGYEPAELVGGHPADLVHPEDLANILSASDDVRCGRAEHALTTARYRHRNGRWIWIELSFRGARDPATGGYDGFVATLRDVDERRMAEDQLRFSEARHRALVDALPQMVVVASAATGEASFTNRPYEAYCGRASLSRAARLALVHADDLDRCEELWIDARARRGRYEGEVRLRRCDGVYRWHKIVMVPIERDGVIDTIVTTALDVDDLISTRRELERASDLLRMAQDAAGAGVWEWDPASDRLSLSPASARLHGLPGTGGLDTMTVVPLSAWKARVVPEDLPGVRAAVRRNRAQGTINTAEFRTLAPEMPGGCRWVQSFGRLVDDSGGARFVGLHLDVTARKENEEVLRAREARLQVSEERLALALESGDDGLFDADLERGTQWVSQRWVERLGYDASASVQSMSFWVDAVHRDDVDLLTTAMEEHIRGGTAGVECEHRLRRGDGAYVWVLMRARVVARNAAGAPSRLVGTLIDVSRRKGAEAQVLHMAEHDALTDLPNRHVFNRRLAEAVRRAPTEPGVAAVLLCDLDRFKAVNDSFGHSIGDRVLCAAAERIRSAVRAQDLVARLGGDEFAVLISQVDGHSGAAAAAERIVAALSMPLDFDGTPVDVGVSVGAALLAVDGADAQELFKRADCALYEAKAAGRNTYRMFDATAHARTTFRSLLALEIHEAARRGDFFLAYQPIHDVAAGTVSSCEALMRWRHPDQGLISPGDFIPVAEETGAILALGAWALATACRDAMSWPSSVRVAVNVSTVQFRQDLESVVRLALRESGLRPDRLILEVTESVLMHDPEQAIQTLHRLKAMGVRIALDDFGTGFSSLGYLRLFPFDKLKIDRSFIRDIADPDAAAIVRAVASIGERLGMIIVVEGVETAEQQALVRHEGCRHMQGFLFSRPLPPVEALAYILDQRSQAA